MYTLTAVSLRPARYLGRFSAGAIIIGINFLALLPTNWMYGRESGKEAYCQNDAHSSFIPEISNFNIFEITNSLIRCHNINFVNCALIFPFLVTSYQFCSLTVANQRAVTFAYTFVFFSHNHTILDNR